MKSRISISFSQTAELLTQAGFAFDVIPSAVDEKITKDIPSDVVMELAHQKALDVYESKIKDNPAYQRLLRYLPVSQEPHRGKTQWCRHR